MNLFGWHLAKKEDGSRVLRCHVRPRQTAGKPVMLRTAFKAAEGGLLFSAWGKEPVPINHHLRSELLTLRARSRSEALNNPYHDRFLSLAVSNVVGPNGIVLQSRVRNRDKTPDKPACAAIEDDWTEWSKRENCTMSGTLDLINVQANHVQAAAEDGEVLWLAVRGKKAGKFSYALHQVDIDLLDITLNEDIPGGNRIRMGIEVNAWNRPLAYYLKASEYDEHAWVAKNRNKYTRISASDMFHDFLRERPNQLRGIPWATSSLTRSRMLDAYIEAAVVAARIGAQNVGVITSDEEFQGDDIDPVTGDMIMDAEPGSWFNLQAGQKIDSWNPEYPHQQFPDFVKTAVMDLSVGYNVDYPSLSGNLEGVNFSSIRAGVLETRETWKGLQGWMSRGFLTWVFNGWLETQLLNESISIVGKSGSTGSLKLDYLDKYQRAVWRGRRWPWVDPLKDVQAAVMAIDNRLRSRTEIISDLTGREAEDVWEEIDAEEMIMPGGSVGGPASAIVGKEALADGE